ncbi:hypothetical protein BGZ54_000498, partial [Gamsiella multidivaricata]
ASPSIKDVNAEPTTQAVDTKIISKDTRFSNIDTFSPNNEPLLVDSAATATTTPKDPPHPPPSDGVIINRHIKLSCNAGKPQSYNKTGKEIQFVVPVSPSSFQRTNSMDVSTDGRILSMGSGLRRRRGRPPLFLLDDAMAKTSISGTPAEIGELSKPAEANPDSCNPRSGFSSPGTPPYSPPNSSQSSSSSWSPLSSRPSSALRSPVGQVTQSVTRTSRSTVRSNSAPLFFFAEPYHPPTSKVDRRAYNSRKELKQAQAKEHQLQQLC